MRFLFLLLIAQPLLSEDFSQITSPTWWDYQRLQHFLKRGDRPELSLLDEVLIPGGQIYNYKARARKFRLIGKWPGEGPKFRTVTYRCKAEEKRVCIISYASYNSSFIRGIYRLREKLKEIGFQGHFIYRIGGWPNADEGSLKFAHVPYAFKPALFREVEKLGYELVLWLDTSIVPLKELDSLFERLKTQGYIGFRAGHTLERYCNKETFTYFGVDLEKADKIESVASGLVGLNLKHPVGKAILERWYQATAGGFYSPRPDQNALSIIVDQMGLRGWEPQETVAWEPSSIGSKTRFVVDRGL